MHLVLERLPPDRLACGGRDQISFVVSSSLSGPVDPSFRTLFVRLKLTVRRHRCNENFLSLLRIDVAWPHGVFPFREEWVVAGREGGGGGERGVGGGGGSLPVGYWYHQQPPTSKLERRLLVRQLRSYRGI